jgi:hypothetical protein
MPEVLFVKIEAILVDGDFYKVYDFINDVVVMDKGGGFYNL